MRIEWERGIKFPRNRPTRFAADIDITASLPGFEQSTVMLAARVEKNGCSLDGDQKYHSQGQKHLETIFEVQAESKFERERTVSK